MESQSFYHYTHGDTFCHFLMTESLQNYNIFVIARFSFDVKK